MEEVELVTELRKAVDRLNNLYAVANTLDIKCEINYPRDYYIITGEEENKPLNQEVTTSIRKIL